MDRENSGEEGSDYKKFEDRGPGASIEKREKVVRLEAVGQKFINGVSSKYDDDYPDELTDKVSCLALAVRVL